MLKRISWIFAVVLVGILLLPGLVTAQSDDDSRQIVLDAVQATVALNGYHIQSKTSYLTHIVYSDDTVIDSYTIQKIDGDAAKNGDRQFTREIQTAEMFEKTAVMEPLLIEQVVSDGKVYINFHTEGTIYEDIFTIKPGWWDYDHLIESLNGSTMSYVVQQYANSTIPFDSAFNVDTILSVKEAESETIDGINMRVFDVELDAVRLLVNQRAADGQDTGPLLAESKDLLAASDISTTYRLWIGADDSLIYRAKAEYRTFIPYGSSGSESDPKFDYEGSGASEFVVSKHGEAVEITPPDAATLNE